MERLPRPPREIPEIAQAQTWEELVAALTPKEAKTLEQLLRDSGKRSDILPMLPVELQLQVLGWIDSHDIWPCLNVSRVWRTMLLQGDAIASLCRTHFPRLPEAAARRGLAAGDVFFEAARRRHLIAHGHFRSVLYQSLGLESAPREGRDFRYADRFYAHGRLAWRPLQPETGYASTVIVDEFKSGQRKFHRAPRSELIGGAVELKALGDTYVIATQRCYLYAWNLDTGAFSSVTLPSRAEHVATRGDLTVIIGKDGGVYLWRINEKVTQLKVSDSPEELMNLKDDFRIGDSSEVFLPPNFRADLIVHADIEETLFLATQGEDESGNALITVCEWQVSGNKTTFVYAHRYHVGSIPDYCPDDGIWFKCQAADAFGSYIVGAIWKEDIPQPISRSCQSSNDEQLPPLIPITFNVHTKTFDAQSYHPVMHYRCRDGTTRWPEDAELECHWWNGLCFAWTQQLLSYARPSSVYPIFAIQPSNSHALRKTNKTPTLYTHQRNADELAKNVSGGPIRVLGPLPRGARHPNTRPTTSIHRLTDNPTVLKETALGLAETFMSTHCEVSIRTISSNKIAYALDWDMSSASEDSLEGWRCVDEFRAMECLYLCGDDDFLVCVHDKGYTIFSY